MHCRLSPAPTPAANPAPRFDGQSNVRASKLLLYLADMVGPGVIEGGHPSHPGALGLRWNSGGAQGEGLPRCGAHLLGHWLLCWCAAEAAPCLKIICAQRHLQQTPCNKHARPQVVNGPNHPGAVGAPPAKFTPPAPEVPAELAWKPLTGWRDVYLREGAEGWARAVRAHKGLLVTDTTM